MPRAFFLALVLVLSPALANEVHLSLLEKSTSQSTAYAVEMANLSHRRIEQVQGIESSQLSTYSSRDRKLVANGKAIADADEVLFQCQVDNVDIVVVRDEYNAFFGPFKLLAAASGHPIQVSKILVLKIENNNVVSEKEITRKEASYHWTAKIFK